MSDALFDADPIVRLGARLTAGQSLRARQADLLRWGQHPLALATKRPLWLHPDADRDPDHREGGPRCGDCRFRVLADWHERTYPKCSQASGEHLDSPRATHGAATDIRAWWPGCTDWEAKP